MYKVLANLLVWGFIIWKLRAWYKKTHPEAPAPEPKPAPSQFVANSGYVKDVPLQPQVKTPMCAKSERIARVTQSLYSQLTSISSKIGAMSYYLPHSTEWETASYTRGIPYLVTFVTRQGLKCFLFENCMNTDTVRCIKEVYLLKEETVPVLNVTDEEQKKPKPEPKAMESIAQEWWSKYWPKLQAEIEFVNGSQAVSLGDDYRIADAGILPYVKKYLETATKGLYTFDSIDDDLIGLVVPVKVESTEDTAEVTAELVPTT